MSFGIRVAHKTIDLHTSNISIADYAYGIAWEIAEVLGVNKVELIDIETNKVIVDER